MIGPREHGDESSGSMKEGGRINRQTDRRVITYTLAMIGGDIQAAR
jgi:hypothetical protein